MKNIRRHLISGIIFIVPITLTIWILYRIFIFLENILGNFFKKFFPNIYTPGIGFISLFILVLFIGFLANNFIGKRFLNLIETLFQNIPFLNKIFSFIKGIVKNLTERKTTVFKDVVKIKLSPDFYTIGFITQEFNEKTYCIFIPTVPNISTGIIIIVPKDKVEKINMSVEDALKLVISLGVFTPQNASSNN